MFFHVFGLIWVPSALLLGFALIFSAHCPKFRTITAFGKKSAPSRHGLKCPISSKVPAHAVLQGFGCDAFRGCQVWQIRSDW